jgi:glycosyltransferase involved in cell wall biosynthesis
MTSPPLCVLVPTYNPRMDYLERVLAGLRQQTVPAEEWDLLVIDNNSNPPLADRVDLSWHPRARLVVEPTPGKMHALATAFRSSTSPLLLILDDDTVPRADLIARTLRIADAFLVLGTWSTRVELEIEDPTLDPPARLRSLLAERLIDAPMWSNDPLHTPSTAWGCGMTVRRAVADAYLRETAANPARLQLDPVGNQPGYGGDTDLSYTGFSIGLGTGVFPELGITHLIPARRCTLEYLLRNLEAHAFSHQLQHYSRHGRWPAEPALTTRIRRWLRRLTGDSLDRAMMAAEDRGFAAAHRAIATGRDTRPVSHR